MCPDRGVEAWREGAGRTFPCHSTAPRIPGGGLGPGEAGTELRQGPSLKGRVLMDDSEGLALLHTQAFHTQADGRGRPSRPWQEGLHPHTYCQPLPG